MRRYTIETIIVNAPMLSTVALARIAALLAACGCEDVSVVFYPFDRELGIVGQWLARDRAAAIAEVVGAYAVLSKSGELSNTSTLGEVNVTEVSRLSDLWASIRAYFRRPLTEAELSTARW